MSQITFRITNITCEACVKLSTMALKKIDGVTQAFVDSTGLAKLVSERVVAWDEVRGALKGVGKEAKIID